MSKFIKISQNDCRPCGELDKLFNIIAPDKVGKFVPITKLEEATEDGVLYTIRADEHPEIAAHFELMGVPVIIELHEDRKPTIIYKPVGQDLEYIANNLK